MIGDNSRKSLYVSAQENFVKQDVLKRLNSILGEIRYLRNFNSARLAKIDEILSVTCDAVASDINARA